MKDAEGNTKVNDTRIILGEIQQCITSNCNGWLVDSFVGKYWIQCIDPKHHLTYQKGIRKQVANIESQLNQQPVSNSTDPFTGTEDGIR